MVVSDSLVYHFDPGSTRSTFYDTSSSHVTNLVNMEGEVKFVSTDKATSLNSQNGFNYLSMDGTNDYMRIAHEDNSSINTQGSITVGCWCRLDNDTLFATVSKYNQYILGQNHSNDMIFIVYTTSWYPGGYNSAGKFGDQSSIDKSKWHYWVGTYQKNPDPNSNGFTSLYCDGEPLAVNLDTFKGSGDQNGALSSDVGHVRFFRRDSGSSNIHQGDIGMTHCYSRALSAQEVKQNYIATRGRFQR